MIFMIVYGIIGTKVQVIEVKEQDKRVTTGTTQNFNKDSNSFKLNVDNGEKKTYEVAISKTAKAVVYTLEKDSSGQEFAATKEEKKISEVPDLIASDLSDGKKVTVIGDRDETNSTIRASVLHLGGIKGIKMFKARNETEDIYNTAVILCIACVGLGDSDMNRLLQITIIFACVMVAYVVMMVIVKSVRRNA